MNNQVMLIGRVGGKPEIKMFNNNERETKLAKFSLAVKEIASGNEQKTMWVQIDAWNKVADRVEKTITRGREIAITGQLAINNFVSKDKEGVETNVSRPVIRLTSFHLCDRKPKAEETQTEVEVEE